MGQPCTFSIASITDSVALNHTIFSHNITGPWINETLISLIGTYDSAFIELTLNSTVGLCQGYKWTIFDVEGNSVATGIYTFITTSLPPPPSSGDDDTSGDDDIEPLVETVDAIRDFSIENWGIVTFFAIPSFVGGALYLSRRD